MKIIKMLASFMCLLLWIMPSTSCAHRISKDSDFGPGETLPPLNAEETNHAAGEPGDLSEAEAYWLKGGSVYHSDLDCYHLANKEDIRYGSVEDAAYAGKSKLCSICAKNQEAVTETETESGVDTDTHVDTDTTVDTETETETETQTHPVGDTVYWTESGKVYHRSTDCRYIRNSANVLEGTVEDSGKERACSACGP